MSALTAPIAHDARPLAPLTRLATVAFFCPKSGRVAMNTTISVEGHLELLQMRDNLSDTVCFPTEFQGGLEHLPFI